MKKNTISALLFSGASLLLSSCGGENIYDLDKPGAAAAIQQQILDEVGDLMTYEVSITSQGELNTALDYVVVTSENDESTAMQNIFQILGSGDPSTDIEDNEHFVKNFIKGGSKKLSEIDFDIIQSNYDEAKKIIPVEYIKHSLYSYDIKFDNGKRADRFIVNALLKDESDHFEGGNMVTNYYEFIFSMDENGSLIVE